MISVIVPYKEDRGHLKQCLDSIKAQSWLDFEIIESQSDGSLPVNFNEGLRRANGEFVKMVQDDDWLPVDGLKSLVQYICNSPWIMGNVYQMRCNEDNEYYMSHIHKPPYFDFAQQTIRYDMHMGSTLYRTDVLRAIGGMDETLLTGEEYDMHLKLLSLNYNPAYIDKEVYHYRMWQGGKSVIFRKQNKTWRKNELKKIQARYINKI